MRYQSIWISNNKTHNFKLMKTMKNKVSLRRMLWLLCLPLLFTACKDNMDEHYEVPDWVADNAWEVLSSSEHGNYSIFLQGVCLLYTSDAADE